MIFFSFTKESCCVLQYYTLLLFLNFSGLSFYSFETLKIGLLEHFPDWFGQPCPMGDGSLVLILPAKLICGGLAGAFAQTVS